MSDVVRYSMVHGSDSGYLFILFVTLRRSDAYYWFVNISILENCGCQMAKVGRKHWCALGQKEHKNILAAGRKLTKFLVVSQTIGIPCRARNEVLIKVL